MSSLIGPIYEYRESAGNLFFCDTSWHCDVYEAPLERFHIRPLLDFDPLDGSSARSG